jgi:putative transposase
LLGISRSTAYYQPRANPEVLELMRLIDREYTDHPTYGARRMSEALKRQRHRVGRFRAGNLMRRMGLEAVYPKPNLSRRHPDHLVYPYLLRGVAIERPNQVWSTDITYIPMRSGWVYLTAIIDWYSRKVLAWELSTSLESDFCINALHQALRQYGTPEIFNTDQGSQFTSAGFTGILKERNIRISMDGRGRALDNIFVERLWRSLKYEQVYLHDYATVGDARLDIGSYFTDYNQRRLHQSLDYRTPDEVYFTLNQATLKAA